MNMTRSTLVVFSALALLAGCASKVPLENKPAAVEVRTPIATTPQGTGTDGATSRGTLPPTSVAKVDLTKDVPVDPSGTASTGRVVYFDYDSFVVKDDSRNVIESHAKLLSTDRSKKFSVEGHTDERGGSEYNLALGQKRAESVVKALVLLGATDAQLEAVSFGKERPAVQGSDESAWAKSRRAELKPR